MDNKRDLIFPIVLLFFTWVLPIMCMENQIVSREKVDMGGKMLAVATLKHQTLWYNDGNFAGAKLQKKNGFIVAIRTFGAPKRGVFTVTRPATPVEVELYKRFF